VSRVQRNIEANTEELLVRQPASPIHKNLAARRIRERESPAINSTTLLEQGEWIRAELGGEVRREDREGG